jgi:hypothetical protein
MLASVDFVIEQRYEADPDTVARAYTERALYELIGRQRSSLGRPEVLSIEHDEVGLRAVLEVRYRFSGDLNATARRALDPDKLTWVEHSTHDLAARTVEFRLVPDHYRDRFRASGRAAIEPGARSAGAARTVRGSLRVTAPLVGRLVENAIVSGLRDHLTGEARAVDRFLAG